MIFQYSVPDAPVVIFDEVPLQSDGVKEPLPGTRPTVRLYQSVLLNATRLCSPVAAETEDRVTHEFALTVVTGIVKLP